MSWPWSQLGLPGPSGLSEVRHAYAEKLKTTHPEEDPEGFQRLHSAYQLASRMARQREKASPEMPPESPPKAQPPQPREQDFDYDELLRGGGEPPRPLQDEEREQDFDFDELLQEDSAPPPSRGEEERDFDFERLFAEGEAERAEARRRRGEERRRAQAQARASQRERQKAQEWAWKREFWQRQEEQNTRDRERLDRFRQEQNRWESTETILHTIEMMYNARAGAEVWRKFFMGPLFQQNKGSLDLIFGLEDFVSSKSLSQEARLALFLAYGFDKGVSRPELRPLYQMLLPAWRASRSEKVRERNLAILGVVLGAALPFVIVPLLDWGLIPALGVSLSMVWVAWVVRKGIKLGNANKRSLGQKVSPKQERRSVILGVGAVIGAILLLAWLKSLPQDAFWKLLPASDPREQVCRYLEEDFGEQFRSAYNKNSPDERLSNVFTLEDDPARRFLAGPDGDRKDGQPGYTTNYPEMSMLWALKDFAREREITGVDTVDRNQGLEAWETSGTFLITLPFYGAGDTITQLGGLLEELSRERWYQVRTPDCELVLCGRPMEEGRLILFRYRPEEGAFDAPAVRELYETSFAHSYCAQLLKECGLDRDFLRGGEEPYTLTNEGMAELKGETCCKLFGLDQSGGVALEYYVDIEGTVIYCVPGDFWATGGQEEQISFYRVLHRKDASGPLGIVNLFYPWLTVS